MGNHHAMFGGRAILALGLVVPALASADPGRCVDLQFTPAPDLQIVAWVAKPTGEYVDTVFITQQTGSFGLGNRPGRFDFNSGPNWPYGRRVTVFPVWAGRNGMMFPRVDFQNADDSNLSHQANQSSR